MTACVQPGWFTSAGASPSQWPRSRRAPAPTRLVAVAADDPADAVASAPAERVVIRGTRVVARTRAEREYPSLP
jgi:hypothetical protein